MVKVQKMVVGKDAVASEEGEPSALMKAVKKTVKKAKEGKGKKLRRKIDTSSRGIIMLNHVPHGFYEEEMKNYFSQFGKVLRVRVARSKKTGNSRGYAYVEFEFQEVAKIAAEAMNNYLMFERLIKCELLPPTTVARKIFRDKYIRADKYPKLAARKKRIAEEDTELTEEESKDILQQRLSKLNERNRKLAEMGINYQFSPKTTESPKTKKANKLETDNAQEAAMKDEDAMDEEGDSSESGIDDDMEMDEESDSSPLLDDDEDDGTLDVEEKEINIKSPSPKGKGKKSMSLTPVRTPMDKAKKNISPFPAKSPMEKAKKSMSPYPIKSPQVHVKSPQVQDQKSASPYPVKSPQVQAKKSMSPLSAKSPQVQAKKSMSPLSAKSPQVQAKNPIIEKAKTPESKIPKFSPKMLRSRKSQGPNANAQTPTGKQETKKTEKTPAKVKLSDLPKVSPKMLRNRKSEGAALTPLPKEKPLPKNRKSVGANAQTPVLKEDSSKKTPAKGKGKISDLPKISPKLLRSRKSDAAALTPLKEKPSTPSKAKKAGRKSVF